MKFKIGDKVLIEDNDYLSDLAGEIGVIKNIFTTCNVEITFGEEKKTYNIYDSNLELVGNKENFKKCKYMEIEKGEINSWFKHYITCNYWEESEIGGNIILYDNYGGDYREAIDNRMLCMKCNRFERELKDNE